MKKTKKTRFIILIGIIIIVFIFLLGALISNRKIDDRCKEILEYYECTYIKNSSSQEQGFERDIYTSIPYSAVDEYGTSNKYYYEQIIKGVASAVNQVNFRLIDEKQDLIIRVRIEDKEAKYTINGDNNYYETQKAKLSQQNKVEKTTTLNIKSPEIENIINNDWSRAAVKSTLGTVEKSEDNYDYYADEGYKIRTVNLKIFNIVFTKDYQGEVFEGIKTGLNNTEIREILGQPTYENEDGNMLVGYKADDYYTFFCDGEISIYRIEQFDEEKNNDFAKLVTELKESGNYNNFIDRLTGLYPDFSEYTQNEDKAELIYPLKGFKVTFKTNGESGVTIYSNYQGKITNDVSMSDIKNGQILPTNIFYDSNDEVFINELKRFAKDYAKKNSEEENVNTSSLE